MLILCSRECYFLDVLIFAIKKQNNGTEQIYDYKENVVSATPSLKYKHGKLWMENNTFVFFHIYSLNGHTG